MTGMWFYVVAVAALLFVVGWVVVGVGTLLLWVNRSSKKGKLLGRTGAAIGLLSLLVWYLVARYIGTE